MLGKGVGRRALRLTSLSFPVEEEICNTGLSHGQKGGWGNEDYARLRSFLVWETVFAHKRSCGRTQLALKLIIKQTFVCRSVSASKYRLRSNGRNIVKGINGSYTQRTWDAANISSYLCPRGRLRRSHLSPRWKKTASQFHSSALHFLVFLLFSFSCGYGYLLNVENAVMHN